MQTIEYRFQQAQRRLRLQQRYLDDKRRQVAYKIRKNQCMVPETCGRHKVAAKITKAYKLPYERPATYKMPEYLHTQPISEYIAGLLPDYTRYESLRLSSPEDSAINYYYSKIKDYLRTSLSEEFLCAEQPANQCGFITIQKKGLKRQPAEVAQQPDYLDVPVQINYATRVCFHAKRENLALTAYDGRSQWCDPYHQTETRVALYNNASCDRETSAHDKVLVHAYQARPAYAVMYKSPAVDGNESSRQQEDKSTPTMANNRAHMAGLREQYENFVRESPGREEIDKTQGPVITSNYLYKMLREELIYQIAK